MDNVDTYDLSALNANIVDSETEIPVVSPSKIITFDSFSVGITGVLARKYEEEVLKADNNTSQNLTVLDETTALQEEISRLKDEADIVIVLASTGLEAAKEIARDIDGINVIVVGHGTGQTDVPMYINGTYIVKAGYCGQSIGKLTLYLGNNNKVADFENSIVTLDKNIEEDTEILNLTDRYHESLEQYREELFDIEQIVPDSGGYYTGAALCKSDTDKGLVSHQ